jgi:hypothetical protein
MADSSDKSLGRAGRKLGLRVPEPDLEEDESIRWEDRANRFQAKVYAIGGGLYLTNRRLIFVPNKIESKIFFGKTWSANLGDLDRAFVGGGLLKTVRDQRGHPDGETPRRRSGLSRTCLAGPDRLGYKERLTDVRLRRNVWILPDI